MKSAKHFSLSFLSV